MTKPTKEQRLYVYTEGLKLMEENKTWGEDEDFNSGLCIILSSLILEATDSWMYLDELPKNYFPEITRQKRNPEATGGYWFKGREERMNVLRKAIKMLENV